MSRHVELNTFQCQGFVNTSKNRFLSGPYMLTNPIITWGPSVWPHLFCGAGHEKRRGEQLKWSLAFRLYIGSFPCSQLPGPVHTARLD